MSKAFCMSVMVRALKVTMLVCCVGVASSEEDAVRLGSRFDAEPVRVSADLIARVAGEDSSAHSTPLPSLIGPSSSMCSGKLAIP
jgi:hypothetical protein